MASLPNLKEGSIYEKIISHVSLLIIHYIIFQAQLCCLVRTVSCFFFIIHTLPDPILLLRKNRKFFLLCLNFLVAQPGDNTRIEFGHQFLCEHHLVIWTLHLGDLGGGTVFYIYPLFCYISIVSSKVFPPTNFKSKLDTDLLFALYYLLTTILYYFHSSPLHSSYWPLF